MAACRHVIRSFHITDGEEKHAGRSISPRSRHHPLKQNETSRWRQNGYKMIITSLNFQSVTIHFDVIPTSLTLYRDPSSWSAGLESARRDGTLRNGASRLRHSASRRFAGVPWPLLYWSPRGGNIVGIEGRVGPTRIMRDRHGTRTIAADRRKSPVP